MSFQNNNYTTAPTSSNTYILRKLNNIDQAQVLKREREDWMRLYHKTLKGIEAMIDVQRMVKDLKKIAEETNMTITEMEGMILTASINNQMVNTMNITQISEDLRYVVQSNTDERALQIQRMLADKLDQYKGKGNRYMKENIQEIQELYIDKEIEKEEEKMEDKEVILIKPYEVSIATTSSTLQTSFITKEVENLSKYMKFVQAPTQTRIF